MSLVSNAVWVTGGVNGESGLHCCVGDVWVTCRVGDGRSKR